MTIDTAPKGEFDALLERAAKITRLNAGKASPGPWRHRELTQHSEGFGDELVADQLVDADGRSLAEGDDNHGNFDAADAAYAAEAANSAPALAAAVTMLVPALRRLSVTERALDDEIRRITDIATGVVQDIRSVEERRDDRRLPGATAARDAAVRDLLALVERIDRSVGSGR